MHRLVATASSVLQDALLVAVTGVLLFLYAGRALEGSLSSGLIASEQSLLLGVYLTRRRSRTTSTRMQDWAVAALGCWLPLTLRPMAGGGALVAAGLFVQTAGLVLTIVCLGTLGRSFGIVAADRGLKTYGVYRVVRHPIYLCHIVTVGGFALANASSWNFAVLALVFVFQLTRIRAEERILNSSADYATYRSSVRWRLVPGLY